MSANLTLAIAAGVLVACGIYLLLERSLTRILIGVILTSNGVNVLFLIASGARGGSPILGKTDPGDMSDPLPQAMVLTAIVITLAVTAFVLTLAIAASSCMGTTRWPTTWRTRASATWPRPTRPPNPMKKRSSPTRARMW